MPYPRRIHLVSRSVMIAAILAVLSVLTGSQCFAQDNSLEVLIHRLDRLDSDMSGLQRRLANEGQASSTAARPMQPTEPSYNLLAAQEIRLNELAEQLRSLTGQIEQAQHSVDQALEHISRMSAEMVARFENVEKDISSMSPAEIMSDQDDSSEPTSSNVNSNSRAASNQVVSIQSDPNMDRFETMGVLGEISSESDGELDRFAAEEENTATDVSPIADNQATFDNPEKSYDAAYQLLRRADYVGAEQALRIFIERYPDHQLAGNAFYWLGETFYVRNDYEQAAVAFARGYKNFPSGAKAPDNLLKLGISFRGMEQSAEACHTFAKLQLDHSDAPAVILTRLEQERAKAGCQ